MKSTLLLALTVIVLVVALGSVVGLMHLAKTSEVSRVTESAQ